MNLLKYHPRDAPLVKHTQRSSKSHRGRLQKRMSSSPILPTKIDTSRLSFLFPRLLTTAFLVFAALIIQRTVFQMQAEKNHISTTGADARYNCVVDTCNDDWAAIGGPGDTNIDTGNCNSIRHALKMSSLKPNITGHWCKAYLAAKRCASKRYRYMIFRDDDTKVDVPKLMALMADSDSDYGLMASYRWRSKHLVTNWFVLDTQSEWACTVMKQWWDAAKRDHPEHDQKYFNKLVKCGDNNTESMLKCIDKYENLVDEVHCRSGLGSFRSTKRQACMRYQVEFDRKLL